MNFKKVYAALCFTLLVTCSDDSNKTVNSINTEVQAYYGSYLYKDENCSGYDIQYLTIDVNGISFFDYLGDSCDDTVECYLVESFDITETSLDTVFNFSGENVNVRVSILQIVM